MLTQKAQLKTTKEKIKALSGKAGWIASLLFGAWILLRPVLLGNAFLSLRTML